MSGYNIVFRGFGLINTLPRPEETEAKSALRVGGPETLNVYTVG